MICQCYSCHGKKDFQLKTVAAHLENDKQELEYLTEFGDPESQAKTYTIHIMRNQILLNDFNMQRTKRPTRSRAQRASSSSNPTRPTRSNSTLVSHVETDFIAELDVDDGDKEANEMDVDYIDKELHESGAEYPTSPSPDPAKVYIGDVESSSDVSEEMAQFTQTDEDVNTNHDLSDESDNSDIGDNSNSANVQSLPDVVVKLQEELRGGYTCPPEPPKTEILPRDLEYGEQISLAHYISWWKTNSTVAAYNSQRALISNITKTPILSLHNVRRLAESLVHFHVVMVDMCPISCMAYTGQYANLTQCTHRMKKNVLCNQPRYRSKAGASSMSKKKPAARKQFAVLPVMATIRALFANESSSRDMRYRDTCLQEALHLVGTAIKYQDFPNSSMHLKHVRHMNLFKNPQDVAFALSSDGAQLTMKRQSNTWIAILILLNLPPHMRYKSENVIIVLAIPGPQNPQNLDSFLYPLFQEMAKAAEGLWVWDSVDSSYIILRAYLTMGLGDMLGSAKLNGMAGHTAIYGDRFSHVKGAKTNEKGAKRIYYPISPPDAQTYNKDRPVYDLNKLPLRTQADYWETICKLENASSDAQRARITRKTGISRLTLCAASPAFQHPSYFPFDPFHLFYENSMAYTWELWGIIASNSMDRVQIRKSHLKQIGERIPLAMTTLPPAFCGPVRDVFLKSQSQFKIYEWMALVHWYIVPNLLELMVDYKVIDNFAQFTNIVEYAMTVTERSERDLVALRTKIATFLTEYERLYVGGNPANISRCRLCIFQLIYIPDHIKWHGSVRLGSQATVERSIGELGHRIRSQKAPFANLTRLIKEKELVKILQLYYPRLTSLLTLPSSQNVEPNRMFSRQPPSPKNKLRGDKAHKDLGADLDAIMKWLGHPNISLENFERWGKIRLCKYVLRSALFELPEDPLKRHYRWFKAKGENNYGEALAFYRINFRGEIKELVVYKPLIEIETYFGTFIRGKWSEELRVLEISSILTIVGIWRVPDSEPETIYVLQKHPGLEMLAQHMPDKAEMEVEDATGETELPTHT